MSTKHFRAARRIWSAVRMALAEKGRRGARGVMVEAMEGRVMLAATPQVVWSTYIGGSGNEEVGPGGLAIDANGNRIVGGWTESATLPQALNAYHMGDDNDGFVTKFNSSGTALWTRYIGGGDYTTGLGIAVDAAGNTFITGDTGAPNLDGATNQGHGGKEAWLAKVDGNGALLWSIYLGGSGDDRAKRVAVDGNGDAYVTGFTKSSDFAGASGSFGGGEDAFVAKVDSAGVVQWARYIGGNGNDRVSGIAVTAAGEATVAGVTSSAGLSQAINSYLGGTSDAFVAKLDASGAVQRITYLGGSGDDWGQLGDLAAGVAVDGAGDAFVTGYTASTNLGHATNAALGGGDGYLCKVDATGTLVWSTYLGRAAMDAGVSVALDAGGNAMVAGAMGVFSAGMNGFLAKVSPGGSLVSQVGIGGSSWDMATSVVLDGAGTAWVSGGTWSSNLPLANNAIHGGDPSNPDEPYDAYVAKVSLPSEWVVDTALPTARDQFAEAVINGKIYVFAGCTPTQRNVNTAVVYDSATHTWSSVASDPNHGGAGTQEITGAEVNGKFYAITEYSGTAWMEEYDPGTDTWTSKAARPTGGSANPAVVYNGEIYVFGGETTVNNTTVYSTTVEAYNPATDSWRHVTDMPQALRGEAVAVVGNRVYLIGGVDKATGLLFASEEAYDFQTDQWITSGFAPMAVPQATSYASAAPVVDGRIYLIGGAQGTSMQNVWVTSAVNIYDPATNTWTAGPALPAARMRGGAVAIGNTIYFIGGNIGVDDITNSTTVQSSVWSWQVPAYVNHAPTASVLSKSVNQNNTLAFTAANFKGAFSDPDAGNTLQTVEILSLPTNGTLTLGGVAVAQGDEIAAGLLGTLVYTPDANYFGSDGFDWNGSDGALYAGAAATVNLNVVHYVPTVYLLKSVPTVYEATANSGGKGQMLLYRTKENLALPLTVSYSVGGTGVDGVNYSHLSWTVTFAAGKSTATIDVVPLEDGVADGTLTVSATLTADPDAYAVLGAYQTASVSIVDDSPTVYLMKYVPVVYESKASSGGKGQMLLYRTGSTAGPLTVSYTVGGTGVDSVNYAHLGGTATFLAGKSTATIDVIPVEDGRADATLTVSATLIADGGPTYHVANAYKTAVVSIIDSAPTIYMWVSKPYAYKSGKGNGQFAVYRTGSTAGQLTVNYSVLNGSTAVSGTNFTALTGQVTFGPGESIAYINLVGINDPNQVGYLTVKVGLVVDGGPSYRFGSTYCTATGYILNA